MTGLVENIGYGFRQLQKSPGFTALAVLTLALGIGANTAIFSVINAVLLKPLLYKDADRLVIVWEENHHRGWSENIVSGQNFLDWKKQNHVFEDLAAFESNFFNLTGDSQAEQVAGERVSTNLFSVLGVGTLQGRLFLPEEESRGRAAVILSYGLWQRRFGGDRNLVGKNIVINGDLYPVVGILPASFADDYSSSFAQRSELWISGIEPFSPVREMHVYHVLGRLRTRVKLAEAQAEMDTIARGIEQQYPESKGWGVAVVRMHDQVVRYTRPALVALLGAVVLVLLIACANVANLLLVRATTREKEIAIRSALGATRAQIMRPLLVESTLLSVLGALSGFVLGVWGSGGLVRVLASDPKHRLEAAGIAANGGISAVVLLFTGGVAAFTGILFGLVPALSASSRTTYESLKESGRGSMSAARPLRLRNLLVVSEFGLALALLIAAGLMVKALMHLHRVDLGFSPDHLLSMKVAPQYKDPLRHEQFFQQLVGRIESLPGVEVASISRGVPMNGWVGWNFVIAEEPYPRAGEVPDANYVVIGPHYFQALRIPLREGRSFADFDTPSAQPVAIVSQSLVTKYWPHQNPIGKRIKISSDADDNTQPWRYVVGVVGNVRTQGQYASFIPEIYVPYTQFPWILRPNHILVRTSLDPAAIASAIRSEVAALDKDVPVSEIITMDDVVSGPTQQGQTLMWLLGSFATLAMGLAALGIYSVISYSVSQRTREIGVRIALGAKRWHVIRLVVRQGAALAASGVAIGLLGAIGLSRFLASLPFEMRWLLLFDVRPSDPTIFLAVPGFLGLVALAGSYLPAWRAAKVDPVVALRYE